MLSSSTCTVACTPFSNGLVVSIWAADQHQSNVNLELPNPAAVLELAATHFFSCVTDCFTVAKQARYLEQKLQLQRGEDDSDRADDDDDEEQAELRDKLWGANKRAYYQTEEEGEVRGIPGVYQRSGVVFLWVVLIAFRLSSLCCA